MELLGIEIYKRYDKHQQEDIKIFSHKESGSVLNVLKFIKFSYNEDGTPYMFKMSEDTPRLKAVHEKNTFLFFVPVDEAEHTINIINRGKYAARLERKNRIDNILKDI
jgi:hypothetical protein